MRMRLRSLLSVVLPLALLVRPAPGQDVFALRLASALSAAESGNWACSPWGLAELLGMLAAGADDATARELRETITPPGVEDVPGYFAGHRADWLAMGGGGEALKVGIANSAWLPRGAPAMDDETLRIVLEAYRADIHVVDFGDPGAVAAAASEWLVRENPGVAGGIDPAAVPEHAAMLLLGTVSFSGDWFAPFHRGATREEVFRNADGTESPVPMMHMLEQHRWRWGRRPEGEVLAMPYAGGVPDGPGGLEFRIWLPSPGVSLPRLLESVAVDWKRWERALKVVPVEAALPRFELEWASPDLRSVFEGMGIGAAWAEGASFPGYGGTTTPAIRQDVSFGIDEDGTRAAAVTTAWAVAGIAPQPVEFRADRPFGFAVVDPLEGGILFIGQYVQAPPPPAAAAENAPLEAPSEPEPASDPEPLETPTAETPQEK